MVSQAYYIDIHTHLTHEKFAADWHKVLERATQSGLRYIVVNGLEPHSNRLILDWAKQYSVVVPALGIYPLEAVNALLGDEDLPFTVSRFDVDAEIDFIAAQAKAGNIAAIGECGLDAYWLGEDTFAEQERVFHALLQIAIDNDLPVIIHTRKREQRSVEILKEMKVRRVNFHCYGGKTKLAVQVANEQGWWFSIPANARKNQAFTKMLKLLPEDKVLTETDAPFLAPNRGQRNEPSNVCLTVEYWAELKGWSVEQAKEQVYKNYLALMSL